MHSLTEKKKHGTRTTNGSSWAAKASFGAILSVLGLYWLVTLVIFSVDSYDIYPWGITPTLEDRRYSPKAAPFLSSIVAKTANIRTVLLGDSTSIGFDPADMNRLVTRDGAAFNLSYMAPNPGDFKLIQEKFVDQKHLDKIIFMMPWTYMLSPQVTNHSLPLYLLNDDFWDDLRMVNYKTIRRTWWLLTGNSFGHNEWDFVSYHATLIDNLYRQFHQRYPPELAQKTIEKHRKVVTEGATFACDDFKALNALALPFITEASSHSINVDIVLPPLSLFEYYILKDSRWMDFNFAVNDGFSALSTQLTYRQCLVNAVRSLPHVRVFAFDNVEWITSNMKNYYDGVHLYNKDAFVYMLESIANNDHRLTSENFDTYADTLRNRVKNYNVIGESTTVSHRD